MIDESVVDRGHDEESPANPRVSPASSAGCSRAHHALVEPGGDPDLCWYEGATRKAHEEAVEREVDQLRLGSFGEHDRARSKRRTG